MYCKVVTRARVIFCSSCLYYHSSSSMLFFRTEHHKVRLYEDGKKFNGNDSEGLIVITHRGWIRIKTSTVAVQMKSPRFRLSSCTIPSDKSSDEGFTMVRDGVRRHLARSLQGSSICILRCQVGFWKRGGRGACSSKWEHSGALKIARARSVRSVR